MIKHKCNNLIIPVLPSPSGYSYSIIVDSGLKHPLKQEEPIYLLLYSKREFVSIADGNTTWIAYYNTSNTLKNYGVSSFLTTWFEDFFSISLNPSYTLNVICEPKDIIWSNTNIKDYYSNTVTIKGSSYSEVIGPELPQISYHFEDFYTYFLNENSKAMKCLSASALDEGTLKFEWHKAINREDKGIVSTEEIFYPPTNNLGSTEYYCFITNNLNESWSGGATDSFIINVIERKNDYRKIIGYILKELNIPYADILAEQMFKNTISTYSFRRQTLEFDFENLAPLNLPFNKCILPIEEGDE